MSNEKPSPNEDEYFAKRDAELIRTQQAERREAAIAAERKSHYMKCPKCGADLQSFEQHGVTIERCPDCKGIWLDDGELNVLLKQTDPGFFGRVFADLFARDRK